MKEVISSVCQTDLDVLKSIRTLYLDGRNFDVDPCYSTGRIWAGFGDPHLKFDIEPKMLGVTMGDSTSLPLPNESTGSILFDPPFMFGEHGQTKNNIMNKRFTMFKSFEDLEWMYRKSLKEFHRVLKPNGIVVFKCQDYTDSRTTMTHCLVYNWATGVGFYAKDIFILLSSKRIFNPTLKQRHSRKFHCYYFVLEKKKRRNDRLHN